jgi:hypothetical protein
VSSTSPTVTHPSRAAVTVMLQGICGERKVTLPSGGLVAGSARARRGIEMVEGWSDMSQFKMGDCENWRNACIRTARGVVGRGLLYGTAYGLGPGRPIAKDGGVRRPEDDSGDAPTDNAGVGGVSGA